MTQKQELANQLAALLAEETQFNVQMTIKENAKGEPGATVDVGGTANIAEIALATMQGYQALKMAIVGDNVQQPRDILRNVGLRLKDDDPAAHRQP